MIEKDGHCADCGRPFKPLRRSRCQTCYRVHRKGEDALMGRYLTVFDPTKAPGYTEDFQTRRRLALLLRELREAADLTQTHAASVATLTPATWSNLELMRHKSLKLEFLQAAYRALGKRLVITVEDVEQDSADVETPVDVPGNETAGEARDEDVPRGDQA